MKTLTIASPKNLNFYEKIIYTLKLFWFVFFIAVASGMFPNMSEYLDEITYISHIIVSLILIVVFAVKKKWKLMIATIVLSLLGAVSIPLIIVGGYFMKADGPWSGDISPYEYNQDECSMYGYCWNARTEDYEGYCEYCYEEQK